MSFVLHLIETGYYYRTFMFITTTYELSRIDARKQHDIHCYMKVRKLADIGYRAPTVCKGVLRGLTGNFTWKCAPFPGWLLMLMQP